MSIENTARTIKIIPALQTKIDGNERAMAEKPRVCAYARVSTNNEDQINSYNAQCEYYETKLSKDPNIVYMGLYADPGRTGTKMRKRKEFLRMLDDCRDGKITRIVTKSVQRFARNLVECVDICRKLKEQGVTVKFETTGIDTADPSCWLNLSIMATIAEEESRTISHNITWAFQKKFENGEYAGSGHIFGYKIENQHFKIVEKEAMVIRMIYDLFLQGNSMHAIKLELERKKIPTPLGRAKWNFSTIKNILTNEKYAGDLLLQKTYKIDVLSERRVNDGAKPQFLVKGNHLPIIDAEQFKLVQAELKRREKMTTEDGDSIGKYSNGYAFSSIVECGECGSKYRRHSRMAGNGNKKVPIWVCINHQLHHDKCSAKPIKEEDLEKGFMEALLLLTSQRKDIIEKVRQNVNTVIDQPNISSMEALVQSLENKQQELVKLSTSINKPTEDETRKSAQIVAEIKDIQEQIEIAKQKTDKVSILEYRMKEIDKMLRGTYTIFDKNICRNLLEKVVVKDKHMVTFVFKCGIAIDQAI